MSAPAAAPIETAKYGSYGIVTIIERAGALVRVQTSNEDLFWVKAEKLKAVRQPKAAPVPAHAMQAETAPVVAPTAPVFVGLDLASGPDKTVVAGVDSFVTYLLQTGCYIKVKTPAQRLHKLAARYERETGRTLPEKNAGLVITENGRSWSYTLAVDFKKPVDVPMPEIARPVPASPKKRAKFNYYIANNAFVFDLLALGLNIGRNKARA